MGGDSAESHSSTSYIQRAGLEEEDRCILAMIPRGLILASSDSFIDRASIFEQSSGVSILHRFKHSSI